MCDTLVLPGAKVTWLAKNSDRDPMEAQRVEQIPAVRGDKTRTLRCTWIEIPQVENRHACIIGRPAWMWGAEMGVNECGVAIGNEAIFSTKVRRKGAALLGMDLLRLALERASSAENALQVIVDLLAQFGQGGPAGFTQREFRYDNSFLIADKSAVWKLETAGRHWAAQRVNGADSISNALTIKRDYSRCDDALAAKRPHFRRTFDTRLVPFVGASHKRRASALAQLGGLEADTAGFANMAAVLRSHRRSKPSGNADLCMHAAPAGALLGFLRPSHTVNSMIVRLGVGEPQVAFTGTASPCASLFSPVSFSGAWRVCEKDLWEKHRAWVGNSAGHCLHDSEFLQVQGAAEQAIFSALERGDPMAAEAQALSWSRRLYDGFGHVGATAGVVSNLAEGVAR
ncbi:C69 family dipeptidase [Microbulbifer sp. SA54]|uniref:C69 family dipeptidase n=1 Tax=Microbulbifer sp. SA54 TaxID=3401577 RepID=UPI003AAA9A5B